MWLNRQRFSHVFDIQAWNDCLGCVSSLKQSKTWLQFPNKIVSVLLLRLDPCVTFPICSFRQSEPDPANSKSLSTLKSLIEQETCHQLRMNQAEAFLRFQTINTSNPFNLSTSIPSVLSVLEPVTRPYPQSTEPDSWQLLHRIVRE